MSWVFARLRLRAGRARARIGLELRLGEPDLALGGGDLHVGDPELCLRGLHLARDDSALVRAFSQSVADDQARARTAISSGRPDGRRCRRRRGPWPGWRAGSRGWPGCLRAWSATSRAPPGLEPTTAWRLLRWRPAARDRRSPPGAGPASTKSPRSTWMPADIAGDLREDRGLLAGTDVGRERELDLHGRGVAA